MNKPNLGLNCVNHMGWTLGLPYSRVKRPGKAGNPNTLAPHGFPKIKGTILRVPIIRIMVFWGLLGSPYLETATLDKELSIFLHNLFPRCSGAKPQVPEGETEGWV